MIDKIYAIRILYLLKRGYEHWTLFDKGLITQEGEVIKNSPEITPIHRLAMLIKKFTDKIPLFSIYIAKKIFFECKLTDSEKNILLEASRINISTTTLNESKSATDLEHEIKNSNVKSKKDLKILIDKFEMLSKSNSVTDSEMERITDLLIKLGHKYE